MPCRAGGPCPRKPSPATGRLHGARGKKTTVRSSRRICRARPSDPGPDYTLSVVFHAYRPGQRRSPSTDAPTSHTTPSAGRAEWHRGEGDEVGKMRSLRPVVELCTGNELLGRAKLL